MGMNVISAKDHGEAFKMLETGRAVAFYMTMRCSTANVPKLVIRTNGWL